MQEYKEYAGKDFLFRRNNEDPVTVTGYHLKCVCSLKRHAGNAAKFFLFKEQFHVCLQTTIIL